ncbi:MAG: ferrous iron transport protein A [Synergistaceae bacterium]|nr:ferrous iron transport protein A [Synergistaceae bacterium]
MVREKERNLKELEVGEKAIVVRVEGEPSLKGRVLAMGLVPGTELRMERKAPLADPLTVHYRGIELSLRRDEAERVIVRRGCAGCARCGGC